MLLLNNMRNQSFTVLRKCSQDVGIGDKVPLHQVEHEDKGKDNSFFCSKLWTTLKAKIMIQMNSYYVFIANSCFRSSSLV